MKIIGIRITGKDKYGHNGYKEFECLGSKSPTVCEVCRLRFACVTSRDTEIEIPVEQMLHDCLDTIDAETMARYLLGDIPIKVVEQHGLKVAQIDYGDDNEKT